MIIIFLYYNSPGRTRLCITILNAVIWLVKLCTVHGLDNVLVVSVHAHGD